MDALFGLDMQKDTVVAAISSTLLDPNGSQHPARIDGIESVAVNGQDLGLGGYLDIGLIDTMEDLLVNFAGALVFAVVGYRYLKSKGEGGFVKRFVPVLSFSEDGEGKDAKEARRAGLRLGAEGEDGDARARSDGAASGRML